MERRDFLKALSFAGAFSVLAAGCNNEAPPQQPVKPKVILPPVEGETEQQFYERHLKMIAINAQGEPYNLPPDVFFITKTDLDRIAGECRDLFALKKSTAKSVEELLSQRQRGFIRFLYQKIDNKTSLPDDSVDEIIKAAQRNSASAFAVPQNGILDLVSKPAVSDSHRFSILVGIDQPNPFYDMLDFSKMLLARLIDVRKLNPDLEWLYFPSELLNFHEAGHYFSPYEEKLATDGVADQYMGLKFRKIFPDKIDALKMWKDCRVMTCIIGELDTAPYWRTPQSLDYAFSLSQAEINRMTDAQIVEKASVGHAPVPDIKSFAAELIPFLEMRKLVCDEYLAIQKGKNQLPNYLMQIFQMQNQLLREALLEVAKGADLMKEVGRVFEKYKKDVEAIKVDSADLNHLDPGILNAAILNARLRYHPDQSMHKLLTDASQALQNWKNPVRAYGVQPDYSAREAAKHMEMPTLVK